MFTALILVCSMSAIGSSECGVGNSTQLAILQKEFSTKKECLEMGRRYGPTVLGFPIVPIEDQMSIVCVKTPLDKTRAERKKVPQSVRDALRPID
jgi:hypothetical protein